MRNVPASLKRRTGLACILTLPLLFLQGSTQAHTALHESPAAGGQMPIATGPDLDFKLLIAQRDVDSPMPIVIPDY